jgi:hypothetical protein
MYTVSAKHAALVYGYHSRNTYIFTGQSELMTFVAILTQCNSRGEEQCIREPVLVRSLTVFVDTWKECCQQHYISENKII